MSELSSHVIAAAWLECFPENLNWCMYRSASVAKSTFSGPTDWILRYIKTYLCPFTFFMVY